MHQSPQGKGVHMTKFKNALRNLGVAAALASSLAMTAPVRADTIQLGFILDRSGSIGSGNWTTIVNGLASAINTLIPVGGTNTYEISVVTFANGATIDVNSVVVDSVATRSSVAATIAAIAFTGGGTDLAAGFSAMQTALTDAVGTGAFIQAGRNTTSYVNLATDGVPNSTSAGITARNNLITAGVDNISIEAIGSGVDAGYLQNSICSPQPCDTSTPFNFPSQGFYIAVADANGYAAAIGNKITVVTQVPEPGTLALLGIGVLGMFGLRRRQSA
jgi:uncharacterized protein YegL